MRKAIYAMDRAASLEFLRHAEVVHVATTDEAGAPILRTVHGVVVDGALAFHGAPAGEKMAALGRAAVVSAEEVVASIPSYFIDKERACPATTYYRSVQVHGLLERVEDAREKARVLARLMAKYQPEGGHLPIDAESLVYRKAVKGLLVVRVRLDDLDGKAKLGQNRKAAELLRVLELLWKRGNPGDPRAIDLIREANPRVPTPGFLACPAGARLLCAPEEGSIDGAVRVVKNEYWNRGIDERFLQASHRGSSAWVVAKGEDGAVLATARGLTDGGKIGWVLDVGVAAGFRGRGLGSAVMRVLVDHPAMRTARQIRLATRDAETFYQRFGFRPVESISTWPKHPQMVREQWRLSPT